MNDEKLMKRCIEIGQSVLGLTYPNPNVGSLLFCDGKIISEGFTSRAGGNHSEINTIINVKDKPPHAAVSTYFKPKLPPDISSIPRKG